MAKAITLEMGAPIDFSTQLQAVPGASHIKYYIKAAAYTHLTLLTKRDVKD